MCIAEALVVFMAICGALIVGACTATILYCLWYILFD